MSGLGAPCSAQRRIGAANKSPKVRNAGIQIKSQVESIRIREMGCLQVWARRRSIVEVRTEGSPFLTWGWLLAFVLILDVPRRFKQPNFCSLPSIGCT